MTASYPANTSRAFVGALPIEHVHSVEHLHSLHIRDDSLTRSVVKVVSRLFRQVVKRKQSHKWDGKWVQETSHCVQKSQQSTMALF